jgi:hypothetical protein
MPTSEQIKKPFSERSKDFNIELEDLVKKYSVQLSVEIKPVNWLAKLLKNLVTISCRIIVVDKL